MFVGNDKLTHVYTMSYYYLHQSLSTTATALSQTVTTNAFPDKTLPVTMTTITSDTTMPTATDKAIAASNTVVIITTTTP